MATAQATTRTASGPPGSGPLAVLRDRPALAKVLSLLVIAAVAVPSHTPAGAAGSGPAR